MKPQEVVGLAAPHSTFEYEPTHSFETDGLSDDDSADVHRYWLLGNLPRLPTWESTPYTRKSLHLVLELFFGHYDISKMIKFAVEWHDYQAAAKICLLFKQYTQSLAYQLQALQQVAQSTNIVTTALCTVEHYIRLIDDTDVEAMKTILEHTIRFWIETSSPIFDLENFFLRWLPRLVHPLSLLLFCYEQFLPASGEKFVPYILSRLSTKFCLALVSAAIAQINSGAPYSEFVALLANVSSGTGSSTTNWQPTPHASDHSWNSLYYLKGNTGGNECIMLRPRELESLVSSLEQEVNSTIESSAEVILFTCGHHYTSHAFHMSVLPRFEEAMRTMPCSLSRTTQALMASYRAEGLLPMACPRCVLTGIKENF